MRFMLIGSMLNITQRGAPDINTQEHATKESEITSGY